MLTANEEETAHQPEGSEPQESRTLFAKQAERLRAEVPIAKVIGEYTKLRRTRKRLLGWCPLHEEAIPTLRIDLRTNTFQCFGCGAGGDVITFLERVEGLTYSQALEELERIKYSDEHRDAA
jgi:DNA primase